MKDAIKFEVEHWAMKVRDAARALDVEACRRQPNFDWLCRHADAVEHAIGKVNDYLTQQQQEDDAALSPAKCDESGTP